MKTLDKRINYYLTLDTETCNGYINNLGKLELQDSLVYDIGAIVHDKHGNIYRKINLVVADVFYKLDYLMDSAYYKDKLPQYYEEIEQGTRVVVSFMRAKEIVNNLIQDYHIKAVISHNAYFDYNALNKTLRYVTKSEQRYFYPYGTMIWDSQKMAHDTICKQSTYIKWCRENGHMTNHETPRVRENVETLYKFISGDDDFKEEHTGLKDCEVEMLISLRCMRQHKPMRKELFNKLEG